MRLEYRRYYQGDIPEIEPCKGEIKDGTPIITATFSSPHPEVKHYFDAFLILAILYEKADASGADRDDYSALIDILIREVTGVIHTIIAIVK
jgi:hypothetical protein